MSLLPGICVFPWYHLIVIGDVPLTVHDNKRESPSRGASDGDIDNVGFSRSKCKSYSKNILDFYFLVGCRYSAKKAINITEVNKVQKAIKKTM